MSRPARRSRFLSALDAGAEIAWDELTEGWILSIGGAEQSHVDLADPSRVFYEYLQRMSAACDLQRPSGQPVRALHLGAGALTLPRRLSAVRPGSQQTVIELARELPGFVLEHLPWPDSQPPRILIGDAREQLIALREAETEPFDLLVLDVFAGDERWQSLETPSGSTFEWDEQSTYVRKPPYFEGMTMQPDPVSDISGARVLLKLGDSVTTDHISPAGSFKSDTPAGRYLLENGVQRKDFNSYGSRRGNHEVMIRGTFANIRIKNQLLDGVEGGFTRDFTQEGAPQAYVYDAAQNYAEQGTPLVVLGGKEYGSGSSRDWAAKGTALLGVKAVITESFERIHRSNLIGMGVLPLQFPEGENADSLGLTGTETFDISGITALNEGTTPKTVKVTATGEDGKVTEFDAVVRIDTPGEAEYYRNGGILQYVLRQIAAKA